ncbi:MAG: rhodanese-like domain-containing protein [Undibacterium sp.]
MDVTELKEKLKQGEPMILLDVRDIDEAKEDPFFLVPPANYLNLPILPLLYSTKEELEAKIFSALGLSTMSPVVTLCLSGGRSARACTQLRNFGWSAENLVGGKEAWGAAV